MRGGVWQGENNPFFPRCNFESERKNEPLLKDLDMKLGLMQPYFFPYLGYFDLIYSSDRWIVFDTVQYIRRGWINRNRILHPEEGWQYIIVPRKKHGTQTAIKDVEVSTAPKWPRRIWPRYSITRRGHPFMRRPIS